MATPYNKKSVIHALRMVRTSLKKAYYGACDTDMSIETLTKLLRGIDEVLSYVDGADYRAKYERKFYELPVPGDDQNG